MLKAAQPGAPNMPLYGYQIVRVYPHDHDAFTQGLQYLDGAFYEGTGLNGRSAIRRVELETGKVLQRRDVPSQHFGEGITVFKSDLVELTWQTHVAFVYDRTSFEPKKRCTSVSSGSGPRSKCTNCANRRPWWTDCRDE